LRWSCLPKHPKTLLGPTSKTYPTRLVLDQLADEWALLVLLAVFPKAMRFNTLKRQVEGITQKMLGLTVRRLEQAQAGVCHRYTARRERGQVGHVTTINS
jgi:DNA-binding HxlR family transcriptional regulator